MASGEDQEAEAYLTRADMPELVKSVAEALMVQLRKVTPAPEEAGPSHSTSALVLTAALQPSPMHGAAIHWRAFTNSQARETLLA